MNITDIARVAHQVNKSYCESIGDFSQVDWEDAPEEIRRSAIDGVTYHLNNPEVTPEDSHKNWMRFKIESGWVYGEEKDLEKKTHHCLVDYNQLPLEQRTKDHIFKSIVTSLHTHLTDD